MDRWLSMILEGPVSPDALAPHFPWAADMIGCPHDSVYHAEGDPWIHTGMVAAELERTAGFSNLPERRQQILRLGVWMHDIAKPATTSVEFCEKEQRERVRQPRHAPLGAKMAWQGLIDAGADARLAHDVHALVFWHQRPHHMLGQTHTDIRAIRFANAVNDICWDDLLRLCRADSLGRIAPNIHEGVEELELLGLFIDDLYPEFGADLRHEPFPFRSADAQLHLMRATNDKASPWFEPQPAAGSRMLMVSGLPGAGKNHFLRAHHPDLPVIELDALRAEMGISPTDNQGRMIQEAFERARVYLRAGQDFAWNSTSLSRVTRQKIVKLAREYDAHIDAVSIDVPLDVARRRNADRSEPVPDAVLVKLAGKREPIQPDEAHSITSIDAQGLACGIFTPTLNEIADPLPCP